MAQLAYADETVLAEASVTKTSTYDANFIEYMVSYFRCLINSRLINESKIISKLVEIIQNIPFHMGEHFGWPEFNATEFNLNLNLTLL